MVTLQIGPNCAPGAIVFKSIAGCPRHALWAPRWSLQSLDELGVVIWQTKGLGVVSPVMWAAHDADGYLLAWVPPEEVSYVLWGADVAEDAVDLAPRPIPLG